MAGSTLDSHHECTKDVRAVGILSAQNKGIYLIQSCKFQVSHILFQFFEELDLSVSR